MVDDGGEMVFVCRDRGCCVLEVEGVEGCVLGGFLEKGRRD